MKLDFLTPISDAIAQFANNLSDQQLGKIIIKHTKNSFPDIANAKIAIVGVHENRNSVDLKLTVDLAPTRKQLYQLFVGNWSSQIVDLGDIMQGQEVADTYFALTAIVNSLLKQEITTIVLGGSQDLTYPLYRSFDNFDQMVNLVSIDNKFDLGDTESTISSQSYLSKIIVDEPNNLNNFSNIGFQTYYNSQDEINLIEKLYFDAYRLGSITNKIELTEPLFRNADILSFDMTSLKTVGNVFNDNFEPNGFDAKELCSLLRYAGISEKLSILGIFNQTYTIQEASVIAQGIWYFLEGYSLRTKENPSIEHNNFLKYIVPAEDQEIIFYKSIKTQRWWIEIPFFSSHNNKKAKQTLLPCAYNDYLLCCEQQIPERWWKAQQKNIL